MSNPQSCDACHETYCDYLCPVMGAQLYVFVLSHWLQLNDRAREIGVESIATLETWSHHTGCYATTNLHNQNL